MAKSNKKSSIIGNVVFFVVCLVISYLLSTVLLGVVPIEGISMEPTIHDNDKVLISRKSNIKRGDVVVFDSKSHNLRLIKRVIAVGGDKVEIKRVAGEDSKLYVNGELMKEDYISKGMIYEHPEITVPDDHFYFLGDNRRVSSGSQLGKMDRLDTILGKVLLRYSTFSDIDIIKNPYSIDYLYNYAN